jgi:hypothetical protein
MATYDPIIEELEQELSNLMKLWGPVGLRQVRVTQHSPASAPVDLTDEYADGLRGATNALTKAVAVLRKLNA